MSGCILAEDGTFLGSHLCSNEYYMLGDLGILEGTRNDRHKTFQQHYPNGYKMEFVSYDDIDNNTKLLAAIELANNSQQGE